VSVVLAEACPKRDGTTFTDAGPTGRAPRHLAGGRHAFDPAV